MNAFRLILSLTVLISYCGVSRADLIYSNLDDSQRQVVGSLNWWDDATIEGGGLLTDFSYQAYNAQSGNARTMRTNISLHLFDAVSNLPNGQLLGSFSMLTPAIAGGTSAIASRNDLASLNIALPENARLGVRFDFESNSGILMHGFPTIGASQNLIWQGVPPTPYRNNFVRNSLGFAMSATAVPEPGSVLLAGLALGFLVQRRRRLVS
jgi:hypothetical protein